MKIHKHSTFKGGWFIGDFEPSILRTPDFEVAVIYHKQGEKWPKHYHALAVEYNLLVEGKMVICGEEINAGDIFVIDKNEIADPIFLEDCTVVVVKSPSIPGDKHLVKG